MSSQVLEFPFSSAPSVNLRIIFFRYDARSGGQHVFLHPSTSLFEFQFKTCAVARLGRDLRVTIQPDMINVNICKLLGWAS